MDNWLLTKEELMAICFHPSLDDRSTLETAKDIAITQDAKTRRKMVELITRLLVGHFGICSEEEAIKQGDSQSYALWQALKKEVLE